MPDRFFQKFPNIVYRNTFCKDLTKRVQIDTSIKGNIDLFYPAEIQAGFRPDQLAEAYYQEETQDWLVYLMNDIVDPYYEWHISEIDFDDFILKKYGNIEAAQETIYFYRNNWYQDDIELPPLTYNEVIFPIWRKYYEPVFGQKNEIIRYRRKREDWVVNTNRILQYTISNSEVGFTDSEIVDIKYSGEIVGTGTAITSNSTTLIIQHVFGNTSANTTATKEIVGESSGANVTANAVVTLSENFTNTESVFWSNVSYYDIEVEKWEQRKAVDVIHADLANEISEQVRLKLRET